MSGVRLSNTYGPEAVMRVATEQNDALAEQPQVVNRTSVDEATMDAVWALPEIIAGLLNQMAVRRQDPPLQGAGLPY